jgi:hypothetical protein
MYNFSCLPLIDFWRMLTLGLGRLALCEIYLIIATIVREYDDLEIYDMGDEDLQWEDRFGAAQQADCRKFRVRRSGKSVDLAL